LDAEEGNTHAASESSTSKIVMIKDLNIFTDDFNSLILVEIICNGNMKCFQHNYLKIRDNIVAIVYCCCKYLI